MKEFKGNGIYSFINELDIYPLILLSDIVSINWLTQCCQWHDMMLQIKTVLNALTYIITSITDTNCDTKGNPCLNIHNCRDK